MDTQTATARVTNRVDELIASLTTAQKVAQLQCAIILNGYVDQGLAPFSEGVGALGSISAGAGVAEDAKYYTQLQESVAEKSQGIPPLMHGEAVSGWAAPGGTVFPSAIGLGATFSPETVRDMADVARKQMLAVGVRQALSPVLDVARDPRWGRVGETYGEDPTLCAAMGVGFVRGLQTSDLRNGVAATGKHFLGFGVSEGGLNMTSNPISPRELREVFAKPFQAAITEAGLASIMNSYGVIDGEHIITSEHILDGLLREEMGFDGVVVSDYMSVNLAVDLNVADGPTDGGVKSLRAGLDVELPNPYAFSAGLVDAVNSGALDEEYIDRALRRFLTTKDKLGLLEDFGARTELLEEAYDAAAMKSKTLRAARESVVLLKNDGLLPLEKKPQRIAVIGPHGDSLRLFFGCYTNPASIDLAMSGTMSEMAGMLDLPELQDQFQAPPKAPYYEGSDVRSEPAEVEQAIRAVFGDRTPTIVDAIAELNPDADVVYCRGAQIAGTDRSGFDEAVDAARNADVVILTLGGKYGWGSSCTSGEGIDNDDVGLPGVQEELARHIHATGTPTVLVHMDSRPLSSEFIAENFPAIIENWFPGETGGQALAEVLFGDYNPAGRLPMTAVRHAGQIPIYQGQRRSSSFHSSRTMATNRYVDGSLHPLFSFGQGLSYTTFEYSRLSMTPVVSPQGEIELSVDVTNTGDRDGEEVVQVYVHDRLASMVRPAQELAGFARVPVPAGETRTVRFTMRTDQFAFLDVDMKWLVEEGEMEVRVGSSSTDIRAVGDFRIERSMHVDGRTRGFFARTSVN